MPKINKIGRLPTHLKCDAALFVKREKNNPVIKDNGINITNNYKTNSITHFTLNIADKLTPIINKYPKFGKIIILTFEKIIKISEKH